MKTFKASDVLRFLVHPGLLKLVGQRRIEFVDKVINNKVMVKLRQRACRNQMVPEDTAEFLRERFCAEPFRTLETTHTGLAFVCCPVWLPTPIGTLDEEPDALWNGPTARDIRASIIDGSFRYCNHLHCPAISNRSLPYRDVPMAEAYIAEFESGAPSLPTNVNLSHDKSCNLSCPSCRSDRYVANKQKQADLDGLTDRFVLPLLKKASTVMITGSGDPFGSNHFRNIIKKLNATDFPGLRINLITNGQLCDARAWSDLNLKGRVDNVHVSVDSTTVETYKVVRRLGRFDRLLANLAFLKELRDSGGIASLEFSMVVQSLNFREMPDFVAMAERFSADAVYFQMIRQRDIFSAGEYDVAFIGGPDHPDHTEFVRLMRSGQIKPSENATKPIKVEMGNVMAYIDEQKTAA